MKKIFSLIALCLFAIASINATERVKPSQLPTEVKSFIKSNFPRARVVKAEVDHSSSIDEYDIRLDNGVDIEIDANGTWEDIDSTHSSYGVPDSAVPQNIVDFCASHYPGQYIQEIEREDYTYVVDMGHDQKVRFDNCGNPICYCSHTNE